MSKYKRSGRPQSSRCKRGGKSGVRGNPEIRCQFIILAPIDELTRMAPGNPLSRLQQAFGACFAVP